MYNSTIRRKRASTPARDVTSFWAWRGYTDRIEGIGFCAEYETLAPNNQRNYERGRQIATLLIADHGGAPKWRKTEKLSSLIHRTGGWALDAAISDLIRFFFERREAA